jgi:hypothetical protein
MDADVWEKKVWFTINAIPDETLYFKQKVFMRAEGSTRALCRTVDAFSFKVLKAIVALQLNETKYITANMIHYFTGEDPKNYTNIWPILHRFGDAHVLIQRRKEGITDWMINPAFVNTVIGKEASDEES